MDGLLTSEILLRLAGETTGKGKKGGATAAYKVEIDELNNAIILAAPAAVIREIKNIVDKLDISRPQVLIEAVIAQLSEEQANELGSDLLYTSKDKVDTLPILMDYLPHWLALVLMVRQMLRV